MAGQALNHCLFLLARSVKLGTRNSLTTWNAGFQFAQFWDGRAKDLAEQARGPINSPIEMGLSSGSH
ncbi:cytochrome-c peroxidase [Enterovibrio sp. Hal110]